MRNWETGSRAGGRTQEGRERVIRFYAPIGYPRRQMNMHF